MKIYFRKMSKKISIINTGGIYAQTFLKNLRGYNQIALGDLFNNRRSVNILKLIKKTKSLLIFFPTK